MLLTSLAQLNPAGTTNGRKRIVVIGSGAVGLYVASELVKRDSMCEVVVIEAGERHLGSFAADSYRCVGLPSDGLRIGRSRSLGGTTNLWGGQLVEFQPVDFAGREWMPHSKWPVEYSEIAPCNAKTYESLGIESEKQVDDAVWRSVSTERPRLEAADERGAPVGIEAFLTRWLKIPNFAVYFDKQIQTDERMLVVTERSDEIGYLVMPRGRPAWLAEEHLENVSSGDAQ